MEKAQYTRAAASEPHTAPPWVLQVFPLDRLQKVATKIKTNARKLKFSIQQYFFHWGKNKKRCWVKNQMTKSHCQDSRSHEYELHKSNIFLCEVLTAGRQISAGLLVNWLIGRALPLAPKWVWHWIHKILQHLWELTCTQKGGCLWGGARAWQKVNCSCSWQYWCISNRFPMKHTIFNTQILSSLPEPSGMDLTNVGSIFTAAVGLKSLERPFFISLLKRAITSIRVSSESRIA